MAALSPEATRPMDPTMWWRSRARCTFLDRNTAKNFQAACGRVGVTQSMGRVGSALDNAVIESWHSTVEFELRQLEHFTTKAHARQRVAAWIEEYNHDRRHSCLGMRSPIAYELALQTGELEQVKKEAAERPDPAHRAGHRPQEIHNFRSPRIQGIDGYANPSATRATDRCATTRPRRAQVSARRDSLARGSAAADMS